jgi:hypothetical protein
LLALNVALLHLFYGSCSFENGFGTFHSSKQEVIHLLLKALNSQLQNTLEDETAIKPNSYRSFFSSKQETELLIPFFYLDYHDIVLFMEK